MSYDKVSRRVNRVESARVIRNQTAIYLLYNESKWLKAQKPHSFAKGKAMNCSCGTCRGWGRVARQDRFNLQLEKSGMAKYDVRPDI